MPRTIEYEVIEVATYRRSVELPDDTAPEDVASFCEADWLENGRDTDFVACTDRTIVPDNEDDEPVSHLSEREREEFAYRNNPTRKGA